MVKKDQDFAAAIELGKKNADLLPKVKRWCQHIQIEQVSAGLLAQFYHLPIGSLRVTCEHGISQGESMHLDWEARSFILENCIGCPHHKEIASENFGREILAKKQKSDLEEAQTEARLRELEKESHAAIRTVLDTDEVIEKSINAMILELHNLKQEAIPTISSNREAARIIPAFLECRNEEQKTHPIVTQLLQAAHLGPELFSENALRVLTDGFQKENAKDFIDVIGVVCEHRKEIPGHVFEGAIKTISNSSSDVADAACEFVAKFIDHYDVNRVLSLLHNILSIPDFCSWERTRRRYADEIRQFQGVFILLSFLFDKDAKAVRNAFASRLHIDDKDTRFNTAETLLQLLPEKAEAILPLTRVLLRSLELKDDEYNASADSRIIDLISHLYAFNPQTVEDEITGYLECVSEEVKVLIFSIYARIACHASEEDRFSNPIFSQDLYVKHVKHAADTLYDAIGDLRLNVRSRIKICDELNGVLRDHPQASSAKLDRVLGRLKITIRELENLPTKHTDFNEELHISSQRTAYNRLISSISKSVDTLIRLEPLASFQQIKSFTDALDSKIDSRLKSILIDTLGVLGTFFDLAPLVVPELYKHLVDFDSNAVRYAAIVALGKILQKSPHNIPANLIDFLVEVYLTDRYVIIHQGTVRALQHFKFPKDDRGYLALKNILMLEKIYRNDREQTRFLSDIVRTLQCAFREWPEVDRYIVTQLLPIYSQSEDCYFAKDMLVMFARRVTDFPGIVSSFLKIALEYFKKTHRHDCGEGAFSDRFDILSTFFNLSRDVVMREIDRFREIVDIKVKDSPIEVFRLIEVLSHLELHQEAAILANRATELLPATKAYAACREVFGLVGAAEMAEILSMQGNTIKAREILEKLHSVNSTNEEGENELED
ncbi:MAG: hypothetical protein ACREOO_32715 [bacterium]